MKLSIFYSALFILAGVPVYFVWNKVYKDGLIGRTALLSISFFSLLILMDGLLGNENKYYPQDIVICLIFAFAVFLTWHLIRFHGRVLKSKHCPPDCPVDRRTRADRRFVDSTSI